jgi:hypothetical protein
VRINAASEISIVYKAINLINYCNLGGNFPVLIKLKC